MLKGLSSSISTGGVPYRGLECAPGGRSEMCRKISELAVSRARNEGR